MTNFSSEGKVFWHLQKGNQLGMSVMSAFWLKSLEDISVQGIFWAKKFFLRTILRQNTCENFHIVSARSNWPEVHWAETSMCKFHHVSWVTKPKDLWKEWVNRPIIYCIREDSHSKIWLYTHLFFWLNTHSLTVRSCSQCPTPEQPASWLHWTSDAE